MTRLQKLLTILVLALALAQAGEAKKKTEKRWQLMHLTWGIIPEGKEKIGHALTLAELGLDKIYSPAQKPAKPASPGSETRYSREDAEPKDFPSFSRTEFCEKIRRLQKAVQNGTPVVRTVQTKDGLQKVMMRLTFVSFYLQESLLETNPKLSCELISKPGTDKAFTDSCRRHCWNPDPALRVDAPPPPNTGQEKAGAARGS